MRRPFTWIVVLLAVLGTGLLFRRSAGVSKPDDETPGERSSMEITGPPAGTDALTRTDPIQEKTSSSAPRETISPAALTGRILSAAGEPLEGAELTWTPLLPELLGSSLKLVNEGFDEVWQASRKALTARDGSFVLQDAPPGAHEHPSVVWIVHEHARITPVLFAAGEAAWRWPADLPLEAGESWTVRTVDDRGAALADVDVVQHLVALPNGDDPKENLARDARRMFGLRSRTDPEGRTRCRSAPGGSYLVASRSALRAPFAYIAEQPTKEVVLVLRECFHVSGRVNWGLEAVDPGHADVSFAAVDPGGTSDPVWLMPRIPVRKDGSFGPVVCPSYPRAILRARLDRGPFLQSFQERSMPFAGMHVEIELDGILGEPIEVRAHDVEDRAVEGAFVRLLTSAPGHTQVLAREATTSSQGIAKLLCPRRETFHVSAAHAGHAFAHTSDLVWNPGLRRIDILLAQGGVVRGRCVTQGKPVKSFDLAYWTDDVYRSEWLHFDDEDGRFELADLPKREIQLFVFAADLPQSATYAVDVGDAQVEEILIELPAAVALRTRVVDGGTGAPVSTAHVQMFSSRGGQLLFPRGEPFDIDPDGSFAVRSAGPEGTGFAVEAAGFTVTYGIVLPARASELRVDTVVLNPHSRLLLRIRGDPEREFEHYLAWTEIGRGFPVTTFDPGGEAVLKGLIPGGVEVHLRTPRGEELVRDWQLRPGRSRALEFDLSGPTTLSVDLDPPNARALVEGGALVLVTSAERRGDELFRRRAITPAGELALHDLLPGDAVLEIRDVGGATRAAVAVRIGTGPEERVRVALDARRASYRVVDRDRKQLSAVPVEACSLPEDPAWRRRGQTNSAGIVTFDAVPARRILLNLMHTVAGKAFGVEVTSVTEEPLDVVLDGREAIELALIDASGAREGVRVLVDHPAISMYERTYLTSGPGGRATGPNFAPGEYRMVVDHAGYWPTVHPVRASSKAEPTLVRLRGIGSLEFQVNDGDGKPAAGLVLDVRSVVDSCSIDGWIVDDLVSSEPEGLHTDEHGRLKIDGLPEGAYTWRTAAWRGASATGSEQVIPGTNVAVAVRLL